MPKHKRVKTPQNVQSFIDKLLTILQDEECEQYIHWTADQDSFVISDITKFTQTVLPKYFKKIHFSSFIRQLNMYGFNKIRHEEGENVYKNENFVRNQQEQLKNIKRKINSSAEKEDRMVLYNPNNNFTKQLKDLKTRQTNLEGLCQQLITQNQKILEENNQMMRQLSSKNKEKNTKMEQILLSLILAKGNTQLALNGQQGKMLSITNEENPEPTTSYPMNLQNLQEMLEDGDKLRQVMGMVPEQKKRRKNKNYTIVNENSGKKKEEKSQRGSVSSHKQEQNLLSISDFFNMQSPIDKFGQSEDHN